MPNSDGDRPPIDRDFRRRLWKFEPPRPNDDRDEYQRDRARILHSAAFRRLQGKTQVMGVGEGDYHRTRLTHSIETAQIGGGILAVLKKRSWTDPALQEWLPSNELVESACYAHDLGHPPFGHSGERALQSAMYRHGGFEANGQTLRILTRLEKYRRNEGINPTRRLVLAILKYPVVYSCFDSEQYHSKPPKCYFDTEAQVVERVLEPFGADERRRFCSELESGEPCHRTLDATIMECADDIAYGVHDLEDIVARGFVAEESVIQFLSQRGFDDAGFSALGKYDIKLCDFQAKLFNSDSAVRKQFIGQLINSFITAATIIKSDGFDHPLLANRVKIAGDIGQLLDVLKKMTYELVIKHAEIQQLEFRGKRIVTELFEALLSDPKTLIPTDAWESLPCTDGIERRVCDYVAGMTDPHAEKIYRRLFVPGYGSSRDEL